MPKLATYVEQVRSKNAGPFWLTVDIFCKDDASFQALAAGLDTKEVAKRLQLAEDQIKRFDIGDLAVIKISFPRPQIQGTVQDRDMHGAAMAVLVKELLENLES